jgi:hypothetical protein
VSLEVTDDLRLGAEVYGEYELTSTAMGNDDWVTIGPDMSWTHGRFWMTGSFGFGVHQIASAPRIKWGVAF